MAEYCLPPELASKFLSALRNGTISPTKLTEMSSFKRRDMFAHYVGEEHAFEINALLESKLILKHQQRGMVAWAKQVGGLSETQRGDLIDRVNKLETVLSPNDQNRFLADLAERKLGVRVTADEAKEILNLARVAQQRRTVAQTNPTTENITAFGHSKLDLIDAIDAMKPKSRSFGQKLLDAANAPKTLETGVFHMSVLGVQLWGSLATKEAWGGVANMFSYFADESNYRNLLAYVVGHPDYAVAVKAEVAIPRLGQKLSEREEALQSSMLEQANQYLKEKGVIPINVFRASSRAFTGTLMYVRFNGFIRLLEAARLNGEDVSLGSRSAKELADVVNNTTGRGSLKIFGLSDNNQAWLNLAFFAPRKVAATVQMFNPMNYVQIGEFGVQSYTARMEAIKRMTGTLIVTGTVLSLLHMAGAKIDLDPRSQNFFKPQIGGLKYDLTGGSATWIRLLSRLVTNQEITSKNKLIELGQGFKPETRGELLLKFGYGKLAPLAAAFSDWLYGRDALGQPFSAPQELQKLITPIPAENMIEFFHSNVDHVWAAVPALSSIFGIGVESPIPPLGKYKYTIWGEPNDKPWEDKPADPVNEALTHIGWSPGYPSNRLFGLKLSPAQYEEYQQTYGQVTHQTLAMVVGSPGFSQLPFGEQEKTLREYHRLGAEEAGKRFLSQHLDLIPKINEAKQEVDRLGTESARTNRAAQR